MSVRSALLSTELVVGEGDGEGVASASTRHSQAHTLDHGGCLDLDARTILEKCGHNNE